LYRIAFPVVSDWYQEAEDYASLIASLSTGEHERSV
jgi:hypothetical protein